MTVGRSVSPESASPSGVLRCSASSVQTNNNNDTEWQYKCVILDGDSIEDELNDYYFNEGWEMVNFEKTISDRNYVVVLKKKVIQELY